MADRFVTLATFANSVEANQCRAMLEEAGLQVLLSGEQTSSVLGLPAVEWAGVKLAVPEESVEQALRLLFEKDDPGTPVDEASPRGDAITTPGGQDRGWPREPPAGAVTDVPLVPPPDEGDREEEPAIPVFLSRREELAAPIVTLTLVCWLVPIFLVIPFGLLLRIWFSSEPIQPHYLRRTYLAAALNPIFWVLGGILFLVIFEAL